MGKVILFPVAESLLKGFLFLYQKSTKKKDKIGNTILSLSQGVNKRNNHHIFIILQFL
ncbi:hypothetical protein bcere0019_56040 [Bacillus cereus Rock3-28]|nr:hypothetical protein bcere0019_56040 [Bacillus cereus Rock3-28]